MQNIKIFSWALFVFVMTSLVGCAALFKDYGRIEQNGEITQSIGRYRVDPDLNYYISGSTSTPNAIMGLQKSYALDSDLWKKIEMTPAVMKNLVSNMQLRTVGFGARLQGFMILDDKGRQIGILYSLSDVNTFVKMKDEKTVIINTPSIDTFFKHDRGE